MGFGSKWISWINWCISSVSSVWVNGSPSGFFRSSRGLRQGDPLSPYLFVIGMEVLSCLIDKAIEGGFLSRYSFGGRGREGLIISHLLYADDTILFCEPKQDQMAYLSWLLMWFEAISRSKVNFAKREIIPMGRVDNVEALALEIGCNICNKLVS